MYKTKQRLYADLNVFLITVAMLLVIGGIFVYSASSVYALENFHSSYYYLKRQLIGLLVGFIGIIVVQCIPLRRIQDYAPFLFFGSLGITALTLISSLSSNIHGSSRWLSIFRFSFQPSELLKIGLVIYVAYFLDHRKQVTRTALGQYVPLLVAIGLSSLILLRQPDFGLTITLLLTVLVMLFVAQVQLKHIFIALGALVPIVIGLILVRPYRLKRIMTFINPWKDPQGSGFQIIQSLIAIGSGGFTGLGIGQSKQKFFYLPMQHTDFIFSIIAEEGGFIGVLFLITLLISFCYLGLRIATQLPNRFTALCTLGFVSLISLQSLINICVATGLLPTKGIGLPFVSYGNSALVCSLAMVGLIISFVRNAEH